MLSAARRRPSFRKARCVSLICGAAIFLPSGWLIAQPTGAGDEVPQLLRRIGEAYSVTGAFEVRFAVAKAVAAEIEAVADAAPEMTPFNDPQTGAHLRRLESWRFVVDQSLGRQVSFQRNFQFVGPPEKSTATHLKTPDYDFTLEPGTGEGVLARGDHSPQWDYPTIEQWRDKGWTWPARSDSLEIVPKRVRYLAFILSHAPDTRVQRADGERMIVASESWSSSMTIDATTGEVAQSIVGLPHGVRMEFKTLEWQDGVVTVARQPRIERVVTVTPQSTTPAIRLYEPVRRVNDLPPGTFEWAHYAPQALDLRTKQVIRRDGSPDEQLTAQHNRDQESLVAAVRKSGPTGAATAPTRRSWTPYTWAIGIAALAMACILAIRRRVLQ